MFSEKWPQLDWRRGGRAFLRASASALDIKRYPQIAPPNPSTIPMGIFFRRDIMQNYPKFFSVYPRQH
jgi:hypothetical protein